MYPYYSGYDSQIVTLNGAYQGRWGNIPIHNKWRLMIFEQAAMNKQTKNKKNVYNNRC